MNGKSERRRALKHWMTYVRLDPVGPWGGACQGAGEEDSGDGTAFDCQPRRDAGFSGELTRDEGHACG